MKGKWNISLLPWLVCGYGGLGGVLWALMEQFCRDDRGLLIPWNWPGILLTVMSVGICGIIVYLTRPLAGSNRYSENFPASLPGAISHFTLAAGILWMLFMNPSDHRDVLSILHGALGILSLPCLILAGISRWKGKRPNFLFHGLLCAFFAIHMAEQYRQWSSNPQTADYLCQLLACAGLTLTAYHRAAFDVGMGNRVRHLTVGLIAAYFSLASCFVEGMGLSYLAFGFWSAADLCAIQPRPRQVKFPEAGEQS